jgi:hypothetical protein
VVDPDGRVDHGAEPTLCGRCHADAPADHLFGTAQDPPRPAPSGSPPAE